MKNKKYKKHVAVMLMAAMLLGGCGAAKQEMRDFGGEKAKEETAKNKESSGSGWVEEALDKEPAVLDVKAPKEPGASKGESPKGEDKAEEAFGTGESAKAGEGADDIGKAAEDAIDGGFDAPMVSEGWDMKITAGVKGFDVAEAPESWDLAFESVEMFSGATEDLPAPAPGLLTAGEWCDNLNWGFMVNLVNTGRFDFRVFGMRPYERVVVHVASEGTAVPNAKVVLQNDAGAVLAEAVTDHAGAAYLYYNLYGTAEKPAYVEVYANGAFAAKRLEEKDVISGSAEVVHTDPNADGMQSGQGNNGSLSGERLSTCEVAVDIADYSPPAKKFDIMFVFDTTGSMGDELLYLQKEFEDIASRVADQSTRFSVNFYRDLEDKYVIRSNEFTANVREVMALLNAEYADGGGDYEEAVDLALKNAVLEHAWNPDSIKLMFLILDAPPHNTQEAAENIKTAICAAAAMGIHIIPIASSGVDAVTEALLRGIAMVTGGTYTFLTDDSGIGESHLEPTIGSYQVEALNDLIVRLIRQYY